MKIQLYWLLLAALLLLPGKADAANKRNRLSSLNCRNGEELRECSLLRLHPGSCIPEKIRL